MLSGRRLCDELITRPEESYRLWCVVVCGLETSRMGAAYIYDISNLRVKSPLFSVIVYGVKTYLTLFLSIANFKVILHYSIFYFFIVNRAYVLLLYSVAEINPLNAELNSICYLLALLGAHHFLHVSRIGVKSLTFRLLMSCIYGAPILDVSRSHTTTQHSR